MSEGCGYKAFDHRIVFDEGVSFSEQQTIAFCVDAEMASQITMLLNLHMNPITGKIEISGVTT